MAQKHNIFFKAKYIPEQIQKDIFENRPTWNRITNDTGLYDKQMHLDFVYLDDLYYINPKYYSLQCDVKNIVNDDKRTVSFKNNFVTNMMSDPIGKKYILPHNVIDLGSYDLKKRSLSSYLKRYNSLFTDNHVYIFKPITGMSGKGIQIFDKFTKFVQYCEHIYRVNSKIWSKYKDPNKAPMRIWVLQEYLINPLTVKKSDGKYYKFHIRHYYLHQPKTMGKSYYYDIGEIATARAPYIKGDWSNKRIHDTHFYEDDDELFPDFLNMSPVQQKNITAQFNEVYSIINKYNNAGCYPDSQYCFEIFGVDIMLTDDYQVKVIEVNTNPGNPFGNYLQFKYNLFNDAFKLTVDKWLKTEYKPTTESKYLQKGSFIEINPFAEDKLLKLDNKRQSKYTYYAKSDYYTDKYLESVFDSKQWLKISDSMRQDYIKNNKVIDYIYLDGKHYYNPANFKLTAHIKNLVDDNKRSITMKNNLMKNLAQIPSARKFIMPQYELDLYQIHTNPQIRIKTMTKLAGLFKQNSRDPVFIFKPVAGFSGKGIKIVTSFQELQNYITHIIKTNSTTWSKQTQQSLKNNIQNMWVLQEYITDPLLITQDKPSPNSEYKFHVRHYLFYVPGQTSYYVYEGEIAPARASYVKGNWMNKQIHDTHFYGRDGELFPAALGLTNAQIESIYSQIDELYGHILSCINAKCYAESRACYELFGVDLMFTRDYKVKVIEVNEKLGLPSVLTPMSKILFEGCLHKIVMPLLGIRDNLVHTYDKHFVQVRHKAQSPEAGLKYSVNGTESVIKTQKNNLLAMNTVVSKTRKRKYRLH